jgi:hypothetical protein
MKLRREELEENGYKVADKLDHNELVPFVKKYLEIVARQNSSKK